MRVMPAECLIPFGKDLLDGSGISFGVLGGLLPQAEAEQTTKAKSHRSNTRSQNPERAVIHRVCAISPSQLAALSPLIARFVYRLIAHSAAYYCRPADLHKPKADPRKKAALGDDGVAARPGRHGAKGGPYEGQSRALHQGLLGLIAPLFRWTGYTLNTGIGKKALYRLYLSSSGGHVQFANSA